MSILIKGLKMPKKGTCIVEMSIFDDGTVEYYDDEKKIGEGEAVELPDHGDLVDRDIVWRDMVQTESFQEAQIAIWKAPVVIPAERSEDGVETETNH